MKKIYNLKMLIALCVGFSFAASNQANAQCAIGGLVDTYCADSDPVFLTGTPVGGTFSGPGVTDNVFDPESAGVGVHTITYTVIPGTDRYYIKSNSGNPWGNTSNNDAMNLAFGPGGWILESFETCSVGSVFSPLTSFVFLDGSDSHASELNSFLASNLPAIEAWVSDGGALFINSAPNEGGSFNLGFGGTTLNYSFFSPSVNVVDLAHPALLGPNVPTASYMTGGSYGHASITGSGYTTVLDYGGTMILGEKDWGVGHVMMGGMTTVNFHSPAPQASNWRANLFVYMDEYVPSAPCVTTMDVEVIDEFAPDVVGSSSEDEICLGESYVLTGSGADDFYWGAGIIDGEAITPESAGTFVHLLTGVSPSGCFGTDIVTIVVHPTPIVNAGLDKAQCAEMMMTLTATGAATYEWTPAITNGVPFVVLPGETTYTVTGTDIYGCVDSDEVVVEGIGYPNITAVVSDEYALYGASIDLTVSGGSGPYGFVWSHGPTTEDVTGLTEGSYMVTVNDLGVEDGICPGVDSIFVIKRFIGMEEINGSTLTVYPTPAIDNITIAMTGNFTYQFTAINGEILLTGSAMNQEIVDIKSFSAGTYLVNVTANGETKTIKVIKN